VPIIPGIKKGPRLSLFELLVFFVTRSAKSVRRYGSGIGIRIHIHLRAAFGTLQQATGTLKDLFESINLSLANRFVANGFQVLRLLAELDDIAHSMTFFSFSNDFCLFSIIRPGSQGR